MNEIIHLAVNGTAICPADATGGGQYPLPTGGCGTLSVRFTFVENDAAWANLNRSAVFVNGGVTRLVGLLGWDCTVNIPSACLTAAGEVKVGVVGIAGERIMPTEFFPLLVTEGTGTATPSGEEEESFLQLLSDKQDLLIYDDVPTAASDKHLTSGSIFSALGNRLRWAGTWSTITQYRRGDLVLFGGILYLCTADMIIANPPSEPAHYTPLCSVLTESERAAWNAKQAALTFDAAPSPGSQNSLTSGCVYTALKAQNTWHRLANLTLTEATNRIVCNADEDGNPFSVNAIRIYTMQPAPFTDLTQEWDAKRNAILKLSDDSVPSRTVNYYLSKHFAIQAGHINFCHLYVLDRLDGTGIWTMNNTEGVNAGNCTPGAVNGNSFLRNVLDGTNNLPGAVNKIELAATDSQHIFAAGTRVVIYGRKQYA